MSARNTRQSSRRAKPNPALYVGYVEDDETPEMIMKKFAQMEQMAAANAKNKKKKELTSADKAEMSDSDEEANDDNNEALSEQQLAELFNETSYYSITSLQRNNDIMFTKQTVDEDGFVVGIDDPNYEELMFEVDYNAAQSDLVNWMAAKLSF